jgi:hypothetical protein
MLRIHGSHTANARMHQLRGGKTVEARDLAILNDSADTLNQETADGGLITPLKPNKIRGVYRVHKPGADKGSSIQNSPKFLWVELCLSLLWVFSASPRLRGRCFSLHLLYITLPAILPRAMGKGVHMNTSRFTEVKTDGSTSSSDVEK